jgi:hypothetical protein
MEDGKETRELPGTAPEENPPSVETRKGPTWRAWVVSILLAIGLSVMATLLLGGGANFRPEGAVPAGGAESGHKSGDVCCPPAAK